MSDDGEKSSTFEMICGLTLAILAAVLAITDLGAGKYGDDEIIAHNQKANAFEWYQAKGIKSHWSRDSGTSSGSCWIRE